MLFSVIFFFEWQNDIFVNRSDRFDVTTRFLGLLAWQPHIIFSNLHFCVLKAWVVTMEVPVAVFTF